MMVFFPAGTWSTHWTSTWKWTTFSSTSTTVWGAATSRHSSGYRKLTASLTGSRSLNHMGALWHTSWQPLYILLLNHFLSTRFDENLLFFQIQEKPEDSLRGSSYKLHQNRLQHFQTTDQVKKEKKKSNLLQTLLLHRPRQSCDLNHLFQSQVWKKAEERELPGWAARTRELRAADHPLRRAQVISRTMMVFAWSSNVQTRCFVFLLRHDEKLRAVQKSGASASVKGPPPRPPLPTQQFGVSLQ